MLGSRYYRWYYVEGEDAYYHFGGGEPGADILECWEGWRREDGTLQVTCWEGAASFYELELRPADTDIGYQLISVGAFGD